jgi:hypothetical protein
MSLQSLVHSRFTALGAGALLGALLVTILPSAAARQGSGDGGSSGGNTTGQTQNPSPIPMVPAFGTSDSNGTMIAVTGIDVTGSSILYLIDTKGRHIAVYQANGGTESTQGLKLVGARRIDLDLELEGYFDKSEYPYRELQKKFSEISHDHRPTK